MVIFKEIVTFAAVDTLIAGSLIQISFETARLQHVALGKWERCHFIKSEADILHLINRICEKYEKLIAQKMPICNNQ